MTEETLISNCQKGIKASQYELVKRYSEMLLSVCRRYVRDEAMAKDVLQESLLRIFKNIDRFKAGGSFESWMRTIAINRSLQWIEKSCFRREVQPLTMPDVEPPTAEVYSKMDADDIMLLVQSLPDAYRTIFNLSVVEGYSHKEIAALLSIPEGTSRSSLQRARKLLQQKLNGLKKSEFNNRISIRRS